MKADLGILHKNMSIEQQVAQARKVKRSESGLILDPITLHEEATIGDAQRLMKENRIGGIPIVDNNKKLVGILTNRDLRFQTDSKRVVSEVMTRENLVTAPKALPLKRRKRFYNNIKLKSYRSLKKTVPCLD